MFTVRAHPRAWFVNSIKEFARKFNHSVVAMLLGMEKITLLCSVNTVFNHKKKEWLIWFQYVYTHIYIFFVFNAYDFRIV